MNHVLTLSLPCKTTICYVLVYDNYVFHYVVDRGLTFLCLADEKQKRRVPFLFLDDVRSKFQASYGERAMTAIAFAMNGEFARVLQDRMDFFNDNPEADNLSKVKGQIEDVKGVMVDNIEKVLARGEKIELLVDKTEQLNQSAKRFQRASKSLKTAMWWKNVKMWGLIAVIVIIIIWLIASFICGFNFSKCQGSK
jgi:vesicle-associated membrane protein 7